MNLCAIVLLLVSLTSSSWAADPGVFPDLSLNDPRALQEASRVLEEELKLAARPQTYLVIDLVARTIQIKGRGIELHRIPIVTWSAKRQQDMTSLHRLVARPPVIRRKIDPTSTTEQEPISLADMPTDYALSFTPPLLVDVLSAAGDHPFQSVVFSGKSWWQTVKEWSTAVFNDQPRNQVAHLYLSVSTEQAQSLAWSLVDGMALVIRRPTDK
jgi:hypothetical protein